MIITKTCSICHRELTLENFRKDRTRKDGFHPWCKECRRISRIFKTRNIWKLENYLMLKQLNM